MKHALQRTDPNRKSTGNNWFASISFEIIRYFTPGVAFT
jgi:hypothetical protein